MLLFLIMEHSLSLHERGDWNPMNLVRHSIEDFHPSCLAVILKLCGSVMPLKTKMEVHFNIGVNAVEAMRASSTTVIGDYNPTNEDGNLMAVTTVTDSSEQGFELPLSWKA